MLTTAHARLIYEKAKSCTLAFLLLLKSNLGSMGLILEAIGQIVFMPLLLLFEFIDLTLATRGLVQANNRHLGKIFDLTLAVLSFGMAGTAVLGLLLFSFSPILVTVLLVGSAAISTTYQIGQFVHYAFLWLTTDTRQVENRAFFRSKTLNYLTGSVVSLLVITGFLVSAMLPFVGPAVIATCMIAVTAVVICAVYKAVLHFFHTPMQPPTSIRTGFFARKGHQEEVDALLTEASIEKKDCQEDIAAVITVNIASTSKEITVTPLLLREAQKYLLCEIINKIMTLQGQREKAGFLSKFWQDGKRSDKLQMLAYDTAGLLRHPDSQVSELPVDQFKSMLTQALTEQCQLAIIGTEPSTWLVNLIRSYYYNHLPPPKKGRAHDSIMKYVGEVEELEEAVAHYHRRCTPVR